MMGPAGLKAVGAVTSVALCGVAGVAVALDPKPATAPLTPPVHTAQAVTAAGTAGGGDTVSIPPSGSCLVTADPAVRDAVTKLGSATTRAGRQQILQQLTADQRQQVTALQHQGQGHPCPTASPGSAPPPLVPSEPQLATPSGGSPAAPPISSYVS